MPCEECHLRPATVYVTTIVGGRRKDEHLCESCARKHGELDLFFEGAQALGGMVAGLANPQSHGGVRTVGAGACPQCGLTFDQFLKTSLLGCSECYAAYAEALRPVIERLQGASAHTGKAPARRSPQVRSQAELRRLRDELSRLVGQEEYEKAASVRDRIHELEAQAKGRKGN